MRDGKIEISKKTLKFKHSSSLNLPVQNKERRKIEYNIHYIMKPTGNLVQDEMFPEGVDSSLMDMDEVNISLS